MMKEKNSPMEAVIGRTVCFELRVEGVLHLWPVPKVIDLLSI